MVQGGPRPIKAFLIFLMFLVNVAEKPLALPIFWRLCTASTSRFDMLFVHILSLSHNWLLLCIIIFCSSTELNVLSVTWRHTRNRKGSYYILETYYPIDQYTEPPWLWPTLHSKRYFQLPLVPHRLCLPSPGQESVPNRLWHSFKSWKIITKDGTPSSTIRDSTSESYWSMNYQPPRLYVLAATPHTICLPYTRSVPVRLSSIRHIRPT